MAGKGIFFLLLSDKFRLKSANVANVIKIAPLLSIKKVGVAKFNENNSKTKS